MDSTMTTEFNRGYHDGYENRALDNPNDEYYDGYMFGQIQSEADLG